MKSKKLSEQIIKTFKSNGFVLSEPDVLLDSEYIIQRSGENFRRSMLTLEDEDGKVTAITTDTDRTRTKYSSYAKDTRSGFRRNGNKQPLGTILLPIPSNIQDGNSVNYTDVRNKSNCYTR